MEVYCHLRSGDQEDLRLIPKIAQTAEELGFDGISFSELAHDPFFPSIMAIEHTEKIRVATSIAIAFARSPMLSAYMAWDLQKMSDGRFELGLGTQVKGHNERRFSVPWYAPAPRMKEYVESIKSIWDCWQNGAELNYQGKHYSIDLMTPEFNPGKLDCDMPTISIAAVGPVMSKVAGSVCDGIILHSFNNNRYVEKVVLPNVEIGAKSNGRTMDDISIVAGGMIATGGDEEEVMLQREVCRKRISFYGSTRSYKSVMDMHEWGDTCLELHEMSKQGKWQEMPSLINESILDTFSVSGAYKDIGPALKERYGAYSSRISLGFPSDESSHSDLANLLRYLHE
ncbi:MAG: TIGR03617 family F420-dependent LLM class oxidoreductase [Dehalococcoidia bacterium]|nr:TIGR03617 family F420-dependent LLM class oxidoreductase [Dehalococcoidia bacterium]|tara:strand:- start:1051 stop:2073 length:1023 start_codon:yes stop_codon:yes gene_type:complete